MQAVLSQNGYGRKPIVYPALCSEDDDDDDDDDVDDDSRGSALPAERTRTRGWGDSWGIQRSPPSGREAK